MSTVGERVKEERKRLGLSQAELAQACGFNTRAVKAAEGNENWPSGPLLAGMQRMGMDVVYLLSGDRNTALDPAELTLLTAWRNAEEPVRQMVMAMLGGIGLPAAAPPAQQQTGGAIKARRIGQANSGPVVQTGTTVNMGNKAKKSKG